PTHTLRPVLFLWRVVVCLRVRALPSSTLFPYTTLFRSNATPHLVAPGEGGVQVFACLRRLAGWISLRMRTRGSVKKNSRGDAETRRRGDKREEENICVSDLRVSASLREYLFTALEPADPRDEAHQRMTRMLAFAHWLGVPCESYSSLP